MSTIVLILARSGRQLAQAARAGGYTPVVVDFFGDLDTGSACDFNVVLTPRADLTFDGAELLATLSELRAKYGPLPLVWGSGWEAQPHILAGLAQSWPMTGCPVATLFAVNNPATFKQKLAAADIAHPQLAFGQVPLYGKWLLKRRGSCGGYGVRLVGRRRLSGQREYLQREIIGVSLSATFIAGRCSVELLGVCEAFNLQPDDDHPYRFSAAVAVPPWLTKLRPRLIAVAEKLSAAFALRGLWGIDFMLDANDRLVLIELNVRPTATFDLVADPGEAFQAHMSADTPAYGLPAAPAEIRALGVCYADHPIVIAKALNWPAWVADRPCEGSRIATGMPICSVLAAGPSTAEARRLLVQRFDELMGLVGNEPGCRTS